VRTVASEAENREEMAESIAVALSRDHHVPPLKQYVNSTRRFGFQEFAETCEEVPAERHFLIQEEQDQSHNSV